MPYHASGTAGMRMLEPHLSTHGKEYVWWMVVLLTNTTWEKFLAAKPN